MSWRAVPAVTPPVDARLDPYRERGGLLTDPSGAVVGRVFVQVEHWAIQVGGHLRWRRWSSEISALHGYVEFTDGRSPGSTDFVNWDALEVDVRDWAVGDFELFGSHFRVAWLDDGDSEKLRRDLGLEPESTL